LTLGTDKNATKSYSVVSATNAGKQDCREGTYWVNRYDVIALGSQSGIAFLGNKEVLDYTKVSGFFGK
jgi:hypothetical protein